MDSLTFGSSVVLRHLTSSGVGYKRAMELIKKYGDIETILKNLDSNKYPAPEDWLYVEARRLFKEPDVVDAENLELKWAEPDEEASVAFMCKEKNFSEDRIRSSSKRLAKARGGQTQMRMDSFFKTVPSPAGKRKSEDGNNNNGKKAKLGGAKGKAAP